MTTRLLFIVAALLACASMSAQCQSSPSAVVNKCVGADGSVIFSDKPCPDTTKTQKVDTSGALRTGSGGHNEEIAGSVADSDCRRNAQSTGGNSDKDIETSNSHIAMYEKAKSDLGGRKVYASDGSGNLVEDPAAQQKIAEYDAAIAKEREFQQKTQAIAAASYQSAVKDCDAAAKKAQAERDKKTQPEKPPEDQQQAQEPKPQAQQPQQEQQPQQ